jgi:hypothetical protein
VAIYNFTGRKYTGSESWESHRKAIGKPTQSPQSEQQRLGGYAIILISFIPAWHAEYSGPAAKTLLISLQHE